MAAERLARRGSFVLEPLGTRATMQLVERTVAEYLSAGRNYP